MDIHERRRALVRFLVMGTATWTAFAVTDVLAARAHGVPFEYLAALRLSGTSVSVLLCLLARWKGATHRVLDAIEVLLFPAASILVSLAAIECGGITSSLAHGVGIVTLVRTVLPAPWMRALPGAAASATAFPITMLVASRTNPFIADQLQSGLWWSFFQTTIFLLLGAAVATTGSHMQYHAKRQVNEARRLGSYRLVARIGSGGMGEVWLAKQLTLERRVALKLLKESVRDQGAIRRFKREAEAASHLDHPNTIRVFDFGASDDGVFYIAMEFLDGLDLEAIIAKTGPLYPARAVHIARQACASLGEAHARGIVHCDIKPANLFITNVGGAFDFVKVLDFGLVKLTTSHGHTTDDSIRGTPAFMPPEVIRGERVGPESDVYSMGAVLYWLVTGTTVFRTHGFHDSVMAHIETKPEPPSRRLGAPFPADLEAIILRCLAKPRGERFPSARELEAALAQCSVAELWSNEEARAAWDELRPNMQRGSRAARGARDKRPA